MSTEFCDGADIVPILKSLIGQKIVKIEYVGDSPSLITDQGVGITVTTNEGCGGCSNGWSTFEFFDDLVDSENAIVDVGIEDGEGSESLTISIFKENGNVSKILTDDGYGNGYYGGGFTVEISNVRR